MTNTIQTDEQFFTIDRIKSWNKMETSKEDRKLINDDAKLVFAHFMKTIVDDPTKQNESDILLLINSLITMICAKINQVRISKNYYAYTMANTILSQDILPELVKIKEGIKFVGVTSKCAYYESICILIRDTLYKKEFLFVIYDELVQMIREGFGYRDIIKECGSKYDDKHIQYINYVLNYRNGIIEVQLARITTSEDVIKLAEQFEKEVKNLRCEIAELKEKNKRLKKKLNE